VNGGLFLTVTLDFVFLEVFYFTAWISLMVKNVLYCHFKALHNNICTVRFLLNAQHCQRVEKGKSMNFSVSLDLNNKDCVVC
jgi:hypothetical protein